jgi:lia operon protein LiaF
MSNNSNSKKSFFWGWLLIALGIFFFLDKFDILDIGDFFAIFWPVILIAIGAKLLLDRNRGDSKTKTNEEAVISTGDSLKQTSVFGDIKLTINSKNFSGGNASVVFGDMNLDLTEVELNEGEQIVSLSGVLGDINVSLPPDLEFAVKSNIVLGDFRVSDQKDDGIFINKFYKSNGYDAASKKLYISASQIMGDILVK